MAVKPTIHFFCFYYPPLARSRSRQVFAHTLAKHGFPVKVITIANPHGFFNKFVFDRSMPDDPPEVEVDRVRSRNWWALGEVLSQLGLLSDAQMNWVWAVRKRFRNISQQPRGVLFGLYPPFADIMLALWAKELTGWPLILDFRDEFLEASGTGTSWRKRKLAEMEERALKAADLVSVASTTLQKRLQDRYSLPPEKFIVTYGGYDDEYRNLREKGSTSDGNLMPGTETRVVYAGAISRHQRPEVLCEAFRRLFDKHPEMKGKISATFYGPENYYYRHFFRHQLSEGLHYGGFLPYGQVQNVVSSYDVGFFSLASELYDYALPRKLFDYIQDELPILAALPDGEARQFVERYSLGKVSHYSDIETLADNLYRYAVDNGEIAKTKANIRKVRAEFSLQNQIGKFAQRITEMVS
ncbi:MAG: glycosyltransferase [Ignavibacteriales bacterium]|nr:glycosyltransferase [Ignavibacteriales bacterium]